MATSTLDFVVFYVSNLEESLAFFTQQLGFTYESEESGGDFRQLAGNDGVKLGINLATEQTPPVGTVEIYFKDKNFTQLHKQIKEHGNKAGEIMQLPFGTIFHTQTPDNVTVVVMEP